MDEPAEHPFIELIRNRVSVERFDPRGEMEESQIREIVADTIEAPSSFNIQHWRFVAVRQAEDKERLSRAAFGQRQVSDAAVTFIILGDLEGVEKLPEAMDAAVKQGALPREKADSWIRQAERIYADPQQAHDEAFRSCSLAAMTMMLAAEARGLASCPLSGFDPEQVKREFGVGDRFVPVMLLAVGHPLEEETARKPRFDIEQVLSYDRSRF
jgi:nitroreductase